jgi:hypothetical protein
MQVASLAVNDFLGRLCPYRDTANDEIACIRLSLSSLDLIVESEDGHACSIIAPSVGRGDVEPLLGLTMLSRREADETHDTVATTVAMAQSTAPAGNVQICRR